MNEKSSLKRKVLVITSSIDTTVDYIINKYENQADFYRVDVDMFSKYEFIIREDCQWQISCKDWVITKKEIYSVYYRKPRLPNLDNFDKCYHGMISKDIVSLVNGIVDDFEGKVLSKPYLLRKTENKVFQLLYAGKSGFLLPDSFIGNSSKVADGFGEMKSIIKPLTTGKVLTKNGIELYQTNYFDRLWDDISFTPIYLQKYINKNFEVRLTYIDGYFFPVRIDSDDKLDWRKNYSGLKYSVVECPDKIRQQCEHLLKHFDLNYGAFDFIVNEKNEWIFLEVNPNGQWQWLEHELGLPISEKIVDYLVR